MNNEKFYEFVKEIAGEDKALAESIITAHQAIYESETINEGKIKDLAKAGLLAGSLATGAFAGEGDKLDHTDIQREGQAAVMEIQEEYLDEMDINENDAFKDAIERYNELLESDPKAASLYARIINMNLHKKLGIAPPIGKQSNR